MNLVKTAGGTFGIFAFCVYPTQGFISRGENLVFSEKTTAERINMRK